MNGNGLYPAVKNNACEMTVPTEEEELSRLNEKTEKRRNEAEQRAVANAAQQREQEKIKDARQKERATRPMILQELKVLAGVIVVGLGMRAGLVAAAWAIPVLAFFQAVIFFKAGKYFGKYFPRWFQLWQ